MSRSRLAIVGVAVVAFVVVAGFVVFANRSHAGQEVTIDVTVTGASRMAPSDLSAHQDDTVTINITSDTTGEVHLHGYDIAFECTAGHVASQTFKADKTGDFDMEWESTSTLLGHLAVTP